METIQNIPFKIKTVLYRLVTIVWFFPTRFIRFLKHFYHAILFFAKKTEREKSLKNQTILQIFGNWWILLLFYGIDCIGMSEIYEIVIDLGKLGTRPLTNREIALAKPIFGDAINYERVRIDERAWLGPKQQRFCYVSFNIINSWGKMPDNILIHELVHVWQYQNLGAIYIPKAMQAQFSKVGYNYGGINKLKAALQEHKTFLDFNFEQQGDIVSDYFLLKIGRRPQWGNADICDLPVYEYFVDQLRDE